jgi:hypothetical protein
MGAEAVANKHRVWGLPFDDVWSGQERKKSRLLLIKNLQTQRNNAWHRHSMDKKNVLCAATNDYLPVEQEQDSKRAMPSVTIIIELVDWADRADVFYLKTSEFNKNTFQIVSSMKQLSKLLIINWNAAVDATVNFASSLLLLITNNSNLFNY